MNIKNKIITTLIALILISTIAIPIAILPNDVTVEAQLAAQQPVSGPIPSGFIVAAEIPSVAMLNVAPNPVGRGQTFLVNVWVENAPNAYRKYLDYKITVTKPDGNKEVFQMNSYVADGTAWFQMSADQLGEWKFDFEFPGIYFPAGRYVDGDITTANSGGAVYNEPIYMKPAQSRTKTLTVQEEPVISYPSSPLPTDYWTRPVQPENREWWSLLGNYPWYGPGGGAIWEQLYPNTNPYWSSGQNFVPWTKVPESAHIVWKQEEALGGIIGGDMKDSSVYWPIEGWQSSRPTVILQGRGFNTISNPNPTQAGSQTYWRSYDLRTGEKFWERPLWSGESEPNLIEYGETAPPPVPGVGVKPDTPFLLSISSGFLRRYDAFSGRMIGNYSISPMTGNGGTYYMNGYVLGVQDLGSTIPVSNRYRLINWTTFGTANFASRIMSNTTYARSSIPAGPMTDWRAGLAATTTEQRVGGTVNQTVVTGYNLFTGMTLWNATINNQLYVSSQVADHGKVAVLTQDGTYHAYDLLTGQLVWETEQMDYPFDSTGWGSYSTYSAYGNLYRIAMTGLYSINWTTGKINWKFEALQPYQFEGPFTNPEGLGVYSFHAPGLMADGKFILPSANHSPEAPYFRGLRTFVIDAFTGEEIWSVGISVAGQHGEASRAIRVADGYMTLGARDGYMYVFGKGKSQTSVTAPLTNVEVGQSFTISGTVLDKSPAQTGTPAISDEDISAWMEYLHVQQPKPANATGVTVKLETIDPNGNIINIGEATSDTNGVFGLTWTPEVPGLYKIIATFPGSKSYGSSMASTYFTAVESPATTPETTPFPLSAADIYFTPAIAGLGLAIIIGFALLAVLVLKKRP